MDHGKYHGRAPEFPERSTLEKRRSLSESLADGTSKFFSTMVAKKNGIWSDLSNMIEYTFSTKTDSISNSSGSDGSATPPRSPHYFNNPTTRPQPPKSILSLRATRERNMITRTASLPAYTRSISKPEIIPDVSSSKCNPCTNERTTSTEERFSVNGMNVSFDEPIYNRREVNLCQPVTNILVSDSMCYGITNFRSRHASEPTSSLSRPAPMPRSNDSEKANDHISGSSYADNYSYARTGQSNDSVSHFDGGVDSRDSVCKDSVEQVVKVHKNKMYDDEVTKQLKDSSDLIEVQALSTAKATSVLFTERVSGTTGYPESIQDMNQQLKSKTPTFTMTKRRSNTIDEILFDDYVELDLDVLLPKDKQPEDLIFFEPELKIQLEINSSSSSGKEKENAMAVASKASSDVEFGSAAVHRSTSVGSDKSWSSTYSVDSQPDDVTVECMEFMKTFVDKIFHNSEEISQTEKARFGQLCQCSPGRLWFSRYISSQRVHNKRVTESVFFRLMQYFAVCLFECHEADDFSPAKTLMNMCFTFYCEVLSTQGQLQKIFLYTYMRDQPIWQSLRFWNAAFFDAVQCERSHRPMPTNSDESETVSDDKQFQKNITFGQLGTFACNMREFGLSKELCLEFLRKQSTIANLRKDQVNLLRENIERVQDV